MNAEEIKELIREHKYALMLLLFVFVLSFLVINNPFSAKPTDAVNKNYHPVQPIMNFSNGK